jgi:hypothetical protein
MHERQTRLGPKIRALVQNNSQEQSVQHRLGVPNSGCCLPVRAGNWQDLEGVPTAPKHSMAQLPAR